MMNKENALEYISRWIDQRKKEGYEIASVGIKGMEEVHINLKKETPSFNDVDKNMSIVWSYFKDKKINLMMLKLKRGKLKRIRFIFFLICLIQAIIIV